MSRDLRVVLAWMIPIVLLLVFGAVIALAQYPWAFSNPPRTLWESGPAYLPTSAADVSTSTSSVDFLTLSNVTAADATVTLTDASTNCASGVCPFLQAVTIAANTSYVLEMRGGRRFPSGVKWNASAESTIVGYIRGVK